MPTIKLIIASHSGVELAAEPHESFQVVLQQSRGAAREVTGLPLEPISVVYSANDVPVPGWQEPQRAVGAQDVTVVMQAPPLGDVITSLVRRMSNVEQSITVLAAPRISNAAAQVLLHATDEQFRTSPNNRFAAMGETNAAVQKLSTLTKKTARSIVAGADGVILRRDNVHVHFTSAAALETEVQQCVQLIVSHPSLRQLHSWECWVVENFAHIKMAFAPVLNM